MLAGKTGTQGQGTESGKLDCFQGKKRKTDMDCELLKGGNDSGTKPSCSEEKDIYIDHSSEFIGNCKNEQPTHRHFCYFQL